METYGENLLHVYDDPKSVPNDGKALADYKDRQPLMFHGYYGVGYHTNIVKIGDYVNLVFNSTPVTDGKGLNAITVKVLSIRGQYWNGNDALDKLSIHEETIPSYKNWVKVQTLAEQREEQLNDILRTFC